MVCSSIYLYIPITARSRCSHHIFLLNRDFLRLAVLVPLPLHGLDARLPKPPFDRLVVNLKSNGVADARLDGSTLKFWGLYVEYQGIQRCDISLNWESPFTTIKRILFCISRCNSAVCDMSNLEGKKPPPISVAPKVLSCSISVYSSSDLVSCVQAIVFYCILP